MSYPPNYYSMPGPSHEDPFTYWSRRLDPFQLDVDTAVERALDAALPRIVEQVTRAADVARARHTTTDSGQQSDQGQRTDQEQQSNPSQSQSQHEPSQGTKHTQLPKHSSNRRLHGRGTDRTPGHATAPHSQRTRRD